VMVFRISVLNIVNCYPTTSSDRHATQKVDLNSQQRIGVGVGSEASGGLLMTFLAASASLSSHQVFVEKEEDSHVELVSGYCRQPSKRLVPRSHSQQSLTV
jgi:hypothetical protein